jgi:hypothetical protein
LPHPDHQGKLVLGGRRVRTKSLLTDIAGLIGSNRVSSSWAKTFSTSPWALAMCSTLQQGMSWQRRQALTMGLALLARMCGAEIATWTGNGCNCLMLVVAACMNMIFTMHAPRSRASKKCGAKEMLLVRSVPS